MNLESILNNSCIKFTLICGFLIALSGCGNKEEQAAGNVTATPQQAQIQPIQSGGMTPSPPATFNTDLSAANEVGMPTAAKRNNCTACHSINKKIVGPAWMNVSMRYKGVDKFEYNGKEYPLVEGLILKVSHGGSGHWGSMPMPANDNKGIKQDEIKELVLFVLGLAK